MTIASVSSYCKFTTNSGAFSGTDCLGTTLANDYFVNYTTIAQSSSIPAGTNVSLRV